MAKVVGSQRRDIIEGDKTSVNDDFILECVGILANLTLPELDYSTLLQSYQLVSWIQSQLVVGNAPDFLVLQVSEMNSVGILIISEIMLELKCYTQNVFQLFSN